MTLEQIQNALFAAYDIKYAVNPRTETQNDSVGDCLDVIIETLENLEMEVAP